MTAVAVTRSQDEILARMVAACEDLFGFRREVLLLALDFDHARQFLVGDATAEQWAAATPTDYAAEALAYLGFACGKALGHRGISASRSVDKLREWAWLFGRDDVVSAMDSARYAMYGVPKLRAFAVRMGDPWAAVWTEHAVPGGELDRMSRSELCRPDCDAGCGR